MTWKIDQQEIKDAIQDALEAGERDLLNGGVPPEVVADKINCHQDRAERHLRELAREGDLVQVWGKGPNTIPRKSYLPPNHRDLDDHAPTPHDD